MFQIIATWLQFSTNYFLHDFYRLYIDYFFLSSYRNRNSRSWWVDKHIYGLRILSLTNNYLNVAAILSFLFRILSVLRFKQNSKFCQGCRWDNGQLCSHWPMTISPTFKLMPCTSLQTSCVEKNVCSHRHTIYDQPWTKEKR